MTVVPGASVDAGCEYTGLSCQRRCGSEYIGLDSLPLSPAEMVVYVPVPAMHTPVLPLDKPIQGNAGVDGTVHPQLGCFRVDTVATVVRDD